MNVLFYLPGELFPQLKSYYEKNLKQENYKYGKIIEGKMYISSNYTGGEWNPVTNLKEFDYVITSTQHPYLHRKQILSILPLEKDHIIDGRIFKTNGFSFPHFLDDMIVRGRLSGLNTEQFSDCTSPFYLRCYSGAHSKLVLGKKSYIGSAKLEWGFDGGGEIEVGNFTSIANDIVFILGRNGGHDYHRVTTFSPWWFDWNGLEQYPSASKPCSVFIGSDVWIGRGVHIKSCNPDKPISIGNGAVIASDSIITKDVPAFSIVGGNPAKVIRYRFSEQIIALLEDIAWWNWEEDKIYENFSSFGNPYDFLNISYQ